MMTPARNQWGQPVDIATEPIDREFKKCLLAKLYSHPGARVIKRKGYFYLSVNCARCQLFLVERGAGHGGYSSA